VDSEATRLADTSEERMVQLALPNPTRQGRPSNRAMCAALGVALSFGHPGSNFVKLGLS